MDYTVEGVKAHQLEVMTTQLYMIDKKLRKINRDLALLTLLGVTLTWIKHKDKIKNYFNNMKGE